MSEYDGVCHVCFGVNVIVTSVIGRDGTVGIMDLPCGGCGRRNGEPPRAPFVVGVGVDWPEDEPA